MLADLKRELEQTKLLAPSRQLHRGLRLEHGRIEIRGRKLIDLSSWDFLDLNFNPRFRRSAQLAVENFGLGAGSSRLSGGTTDAHASLESRIAKFFGFEAALIFSSRNQALLSLITTLLNERDVVCLDEFAQSPAADAGYLVNAGVSLFRSDNPATLDVELEKLKGARRKLVVVDSISPVSGRRAPLAELAAICKRHSALLVLDESQAVSAFGSRGAGVSEGLQFGEEFLALVVDSSVGLCSWGCAVVGSSTLHGLLLNRSRTFQYEASLPPALMSAAHAALDIVELLPQERVKIAGMARRLSSGLVELGLLGAEDDSPIICVAFERPSIALEFSQALHDRGFFAETITRGRTASESMIVRLIVRASHREATIDSLLQTFADAKKLLLRR